MLFQAVVFTSRYYKATVLLIMLFECHLPYRGGLCRFSAQERLTLLFSFLLVLFLVISILTIAVSLIVAATATATAPVPVPVAFPFPNPITIEIAIAINITVTKIIPAQTPSSMGRNTWGE